MNPGGEPERDDTGLPPVDIEIPDDARELDRDVQAYLRELRAERRRQRRRRLHIGLTRDGVILPLLACCLILALITGTLLTVFTATSDQLVPPPRSGTNTPKSAPPTATTSPPASPSASASASASAVGPGLTRTTVRLPDAHVMVSGRPILLRGLIGTLLVLIPPRCRCMAAIRTLASIGAHTGGTLLVGTRGTIAEAQRLQLQLNPRVSTEVFAGLDAQGVLQKAVSAARLTTVVITAPPTGSGFQPLAYASDVPSSDLSSASSPLSVALASTLKAALKG
ncbi:MAG TPA: hypothetical protein VME44_26850 [Streptosporangiaceae bacterium]|nr:hypothetical protein [Streptosporangiaceae bacterium]